VIAAVHPHHQTQGVAGKSTSTTMVPGFLASCVAGASERDRAAPLQLVPTLNDPLRG
jgi:hypothetical protein